MIKKMHLFALSTLCLCIGLYAIEEKNRPYDSTGTSGTSTTQTIEKKDTIDMKKLSEAFGHFIGRNLQSPGLSFDLEAIIKGIRDGNAGRPAPLSEKEYEDMMTAVQEKAFKEMSAANLQSANEFMKRNKQNSGVVEVVPNKLQYMILKEGTGQTVEAHSSPKIHYTGKYQDGTVFGSSFPSPEEGEMGDPITIPLDQTIPGFSKGLVGMKEGEKRRLFVHPDLGYGTTGQLPPNELLIFDIEVIKANAEDRKGSQKTSSQMDGDDEDMFLDEEIHTPAKTNSTTMPRIQMESGD